MSISGVCGGNPSWAREGFDDHPVWYGFRPREQDNMLELYWLSWKPADRARITSNAWLDYLEGSAPDYPERALRSGLADIRRREQMAIDDPTTPDTRLVDDPMAMNPIQAGTMTTLYRLMLGGIYIDRRAVVAYTRLRYFDPAGGRPGLPQDVGALVSAMSEDRLTLTLVNLSELDTRRVVVQGGSFGEHRIVAVTQGGMRTPVDGPSFEVVLSPSAGATLEIEQRRWADKPTYAFPWNR